MRSNFNCRLLYSDTDSLSKSVQSPDFNKELSDESHSVLSHFDFENHPSDHFLFDASNKKLVFNLKDELTGDYITEFICLKPKPYSILSTNKFILFELNKISLITHTHSHTHTHTHTHIYIYIYIFGWLVNIWKLLFCIVIIQGISK